MKQLIAKIKTRKLFSSMALITIISFIIGILLISVLSKENKELVTNSVTSFFDAIKTNKINYSSVLMKSLTNNLVLNIIIWLFGISIIGFPIIIIILALKSLVLSFTMTSIIYTYKVNGIISAIIYIIPHVLNLVITYILVYYSISFSLALYRYLFKKKEVNRKVLVTRYLKVLGITTVSFIITALIETYIIPILIRAI